MKIFKGQNAVDFSVKDIYGKDIKLSDYKGKKILLGFFRNVNCPFCNLRAHQFSKLREAFEKKNMQMVFFIKSLRKLCEFPESIVSTRSSTFKMQFQTP